MLDLETWGNGNNAMIIAIGAVAFDPFQNHEIDKVFYVAIEPETYQKGHKRDIDPSTIKWWMDNAQQNARDALDRDEKVDAYSAHFGFIEWISSLGDDVIVWGNGATFDNVIIRSSLEALGFGTPWPFYKDRCFRTLKNLAPGIKAEPVGVVHHALHDAQSQAYQMQAIVRHLGLEVL